jgi:hypothetical protein
MHILNADGEIVAQQDTSPVQGRYPTSQWRVDMLIADPYTISLGEFDTLASYQIRLGLYRLSDGTRLSISPADERIQDNSLLLHNFAFNSLR